MTNEQKPLKIEFAPGCFDSFEGTQEELDELQAEIMRMFESGEIEQNAVQLDLDTLMEEDPEMADALMRSLNQLDGDDLADEFKRKLQ
jgi:hypothetical protein